MSSGDINLRIIRRRAGIQPISSSNFKVVKTEPRVARGHSVIKLKNQAPLEGIWKVGNAFLNHTSSPYKKGGKGISRPPGGESNTSTGLASGGKGTKRWVEHSPKI